MFRLQLLPFGFRCYANVGHSSVSGTTSTCVLAPHPPWLTLLGCNSCIPETSCASSITSQTVHGQLHLKQQSPLLFCGPSCAWCFFFSFLFLCVKTLILGIPEVLPLQEIEFSFLGPLPAEDVDERQVRRDNERPELLADCLSNGQSVKALTFGNGPKLG